MTMKKQLVSMVAISLLLGAVLVGCEGCGGNKRLEPGGAYAPIAETSAGTVTNADFAFFTVELTFKTVYSSLDAAYKFEYDNRASIKAVSPKVKQILDSTRPEMEKTVKVYAAARKAYIKDPSPINLAGMQSAVDSLNKVVNVVAAAVNEFMLQKGAVK